MKYCRTNGNSAYSQVTTVTVESLNKGHFETAILIVLCKDIVLFGGFKMYWNYREGLNNLGPQAVSFVERVPLFQSVHYQRLHCTCTFTSLREVSYILLM